MKWWNIHLHSYVFIDVHVMYWGSEAAENSSSWPSHTENARRMRQWTTRWPLMISPTDDFMVKLKLFIWANWSQILLKFCCFLLSRLVKLSILRKPLSWRRVSNPFTKWIKVHLTSLCNLNRRTKLRSKKQHVPYPLRWRYDVLNRGYLMNRFAYQAKVSNLVTQTSLGGSMSFLQTSWDTSSSQEWTVFHNLDSSVPVSSKDTDELTSF